MQFSSVPAADSPKPRFGFYGEVFGTPTTYPSDRAESLVVVWDEGDSNSEGSGDSCNVSADEYNNNTNSSSNNNNNNNNNKGNDRKDKASPARLPVTVGIYSYAQLPFVEIDLEDRARVGNGGNIFEPFCPAPAETVLLRYRKIPRRQVHSVAISGPRGVACVLAHTPTYATLVDIEDEDYSMEDDEVLGSGDEGGSSNSLPKFIS